MTGSNGAVHTGDPVWWALENSRAKGGTLLVLVALAKCADYRKCIACVSVQRLMKLTRLSRRRMFSILNELQQGNRGRPGLREIEKVNFDPRSGAVVYHLCKFCEMGSDNPVLWTALSCPHVVALQRLRRGVSHAAYIKQREEQTVPKVALEGEFDLPAAKVPKRIFTKPGGANGHNKLRGTALLEHSLAVIARARSLEEQGSDRGMAYSIRDE
jgi:hypothetical protein